MSTDSASILFDSTTDVLFRAWGLRLSQMLSAAGLVQTTDTGQINWTTVTRSSPTSVGEQTSGYEIWRLNDSLQATKPVFIKIEYGFYVYTIYTTSQGPPVLYVTVGTGTNGAGTLTGLLVGTRTRFVGATSAGGGIIGDRSPFAPNITSPCYSSGDGSYINLALGITAAGQPRYVHDQAGDYTHPSFPAFFSVERSKNADGSNNSDGILVLTSKWTTTGSNGSATLSPTAQIHSFLSGYSITTQDGFWPMAWPGSGFGTANFGGDIYFSPMLWATPKPEYQSLGWLGTWRSDVPLASPQVVSVLGSSHTYLSMAGISGATAGDNARSAVSTGIPFGAVMMRYE